MVAKIKRELRQSELKKFKLAVDQGLWNRQRTRLLTEEEIATLTLLGNSSSDWKKITVANDFDPSRLTRSRLEGEVQLPRFFGTLRSPDGATLPTGIDNCTIFDSTIGNAHLSSVDLISCMVIEQGALIRNVGTLSTTGLSAFGVGRVLSLGSKALERRIAIYPELSFELANDYLQLCSAPEIEGEFQSSVMAFREEIRCDRGYVGGGATIVNSTALRNVWIGDGAQIDGATKLSNCTILSSGERPTTLRDGVVLEHSILQQGTAVEGHSLLSDLFLFEGATVAQLSRIHSSMIAADTPIVGGTLHRSFLGPQIELAQNVEINALFWPNGSGSVGRGVLFGDARSNPFGECELGKGVVIEPGAQLLAPIDLSRSPWSLLSTSLTLEPQQLRFPFSLVTSTRNRNKTEIFPGWVLENSSTSLAHTAQQTGVRERKGVPDPTLPFLSKESADLVLDALHRLQQIDDISESYSDREIAGLGKTLLKESSRQQALRYYRRFLEWYALTEAVTALEERPELLRSGEPVAKLLFGRSPLREISRVVSIPAQLPMMIRRYRALQKEWRNTLLTAVQKEHEMYSPIATKWESGLDRSMERFSFAVEAVKESDRRVRQLLSQIQEMRS